MNILALAIFHYEGHKKNNDIFLGLGYYREFGISDAKRFPN